MDPERLQAILDRVEELRTDGMSDQEINRHLRQADNIPFNSTFTVETAAEAEGLIEPDRAPAVDPDTAAAGQSATAVVDPEDQEAIAERGRQIQQDRANQLVQQGLEAIRGGATQDEVEERLEEATGISSFEVLQQLAAGEDPEEQAALLRTAERGTSGAEDFGRSLAQGATFGFADELTGLGAAIVPGGETGEEALEGSRQRLADQRRLNPGASIAGEIAGGVGIGMGATGLLGRAVGQAPANARTAIGGLLRAGPRATPTRELARAAGRGTAAGAAEGALFGAGEAEGGLEERAAGAARTAPAAAVGGGLLGTAVALPGAIGSATSRTRRAGEILADDLAELGARGERQLPSQLRRAADEKAAEARRVFQELEESGAASTSIDVQETFIRNPVARGALSESAQEALEGNRALTFTQVDDAATNLKQVADAFKRGDASVRAEDVRAASRAFDELDTAMRESLEGFDDAKRLWAEKSAAMRALSEGRDMWGKQADDVRSALEKVPEGEAKEFFRQGLLNEAIRDLERFQGTSFTAPAASRTFFKGGRGFKEELRLLFPSDEAFEEFGRRVDITAKTADRAEKLLILGQAIAFLGGGTSILGRLLGN